MDGASHLRFLIQIVLPISKAPVMTVLIFTFIGSWNAFLWPLLVTTRENWRPLMVGLWSFVSEAGPETNLQMAGAVQLRAQGLAALAEVDLAAGWLDEAQVAAEASLALRRAMGDRSGEGWMLERLARVHLAQGSPDAARAAARAAQDVAYATQDPELQAAVAALGATDGALHSHTS